MKKKLTAIFLCVALAAIAVAGASLAYFTDTTESVTNTLTSGNVKIKLDEAKVSLVDGKYVVANERVMSNDFTNLYPGQQVPKDPTVTNTGSQDAYVRVKVAFPCTDVDNWQSSFASVGLLLGIDSDNFVMGDPDTYNLKALFAGLNDDWTVEQTYYNMPMFGGNSLVLTFTYNKVLKPGEKVTPFTAVNIDPDIEYAFDVQMDITAEAVQAGGFDSAEAAFAATFDK